MATEYEKVQLIIVVIEKCLPVDKQYFVWMHHKDRIFIQKKTKISSFFCSKHLISRASIFVIHVENEKALFSQKPY